MEGKIPKIFEVSPPSFRYIAPTRPTLSAQHIKVVDFTMWALKADSVGSQHQVERGPMVYPGARVSSDSP